MSGVLATTHGILAGNSSGGGCAPTGLDLSGLSRQPVFWLDMVDTSDLVLSGSTFISKPNKGTLAADWVGLNSLSSNLPTLEESTVTAGQYHVLFNHHGAKLQIGTAADAKFLHDETPYLHVSVAATNGNGGPLYITAPLDVTGAGTYLHAGFWGSNHQNTLIKAWKNPSLFWTGPETGSGNVMPGTAPPTTRLIGEMMGPNGSTFSTGNQWQVLLNNDSTPLAGLSNNSFSGNMSGATLGSARSGISSTNPYQPFTIGHLADSEPSYYGLQAMQSITISYPGVANPVAAIVADLTYIRNQIDAFYSIY